MTHIDMTYHIYLRKLAPEAELTIMSMTNDHVHD